MSGLDLGLAARIIAGIRTETARHNRCPEWDTAGVAAALRATQGPPGAVLAAAALAAEDPALAKPTEAAFLRHWPKNASTEPRRAASMPCPEHPEHDHGTCPTCRAERTQLDDAVRESLAAQTRAALAAAPPYVPPAVRSAQAQETQP